MTMRSVGEFCRARKGGREGRGAVARRRADAIRTGSARWFDIDIDSTAYNAAPGRGSPAGQRGGAAGGFVRGRLWRQRRWMGQRVAAAARGVRGNPSGVELARQASQAGPQMSTYSALMRFCLVSSLGFHSIPSLFWIYVLSVFGFLVSSF